MSEGGSGASEETSRATLSSRPGQSARREGRRRGESEAGGETYLPRRNGESGFAFGSVGDQP